MRIVKFEYEYEIGDIVYSVVTGDEGVVTNVQYDLSINAVKYLVCTSLSSSGWCLSCEIQKEKVIK